MSQIRHIFWKDVRFLWAELTALLAVLLCFGLGRTISLAATDNLLHLHANLAAILVPVVTLLGVVLMVRLVHAERLTGRNQFWTTKPYEWWSLLTAKVLFVLTFGYVPLFLMQVALLRYAQLPVLGNAAGILINAALLTVYIVLPVLCVATLTSSIAKTILSLLGGYAVLFVGMEWLSNKAGFLPYRTLVLQLAVGAIALCIAIVGQYWRRRTVVSLGVLVAALLIVICIQVADGQRSGGNGYGSYTRMLADAPVSIEMDRDPKEQTTGVHVFGTVDPSQVVVWIPMTVSQVEEGTIYRVDQERVTFTKQDGSEMASYTHDGDGQRIAPLHGEMRPVRVAAWVSRKEYERLAEQPVNVRIELSLTELHNDVVARAKASTEAYEVPGIGRCSLDQITGMRCLSAFSEQQQAYVNVAPQFQHCEHDATLVETMNVGGRNYDVVFAGAQEGLRGLYLNPVDVRSMQLRLDRSDDEGSRVCEGTSLEFVVERPMRKIAIVMPTATINVSQYMQKVTRGN